MSTLGGQYTMRVGTHHYWQSNTVLDSVGIGQLEVHIQNSSGPYLRILLPCLILICIIHCIKLYL